MVIFMICHTKIQFMSINRQGVTIRVRVWSIDWRNFKFRLFNIFLIFWSCNTVIEIGLISVFNYISEVDTDKPTKFEFRIWKNSNLFQPDFSQTEVENLSVDEKMWFFGTEKLIFFSPLMIKSQGQRPKMTCGIW